MNNATPNSQLTCSRAAISDCFSIISYRKRRRRGVTAAIYNRQSVDSVDSVDSSWSFGASSEGPVLAPGDLVICGVRSALLQHNSQHKKIKKCTVRFAQWWFARKALKTWQPDPPPTMLRSFSFSSRSWRISLSCKFAESRHETKR